MLQSSGRHSARCLFRHYKECKKALVWYLFQQDCRFYLRILPQERYLSRFQAIVELFNIRFYLFLIKKCLPYKPVLKFFKILSLEVKKKEKYFIFLQKILNGAVRDENLLRSINIYVSSRSPRRRQILQYPRRSFRGCFQFTMSHRSFKWQHCTMYKALI